VFEVGKSAGCSESEHAKFTSQRTQDEGGRLEKKAEPVNRGEGRIVGEGLDGCSQQLFQERADNMSVMSFDESTEPLRGR